MTPLNLSRVLTAACLIFTANSAIAQEDSAIAPENSTIVLENSAVAPAEERVCAPGRQESCWVTVLCPSAFLPGCGVARREVSILARSYFGYNGDLFGSFWTLGAFF